MHAYDWSLSARTLAFALVGLLASVAIVVATDEMTSTLGMRVARLSAIAPGIAALGAAVACAQARQRGEIRSLMALGATPLRAARGATVGAWLVGALAVAAVLSPLADVSSLFPSVQASSSWKVVGGELFDRARGVRVEPGGGLTLLDAVASGGGAAVASRADAAFAIGPVALLAPVWIAAPLSGWARVRGALATGLVSVVLLHVAAAGEIARALLLLGAAPLAFQLLVWRRGHGAGGTG